MQTPHIATTSAMHDVLNIHFLLTSRQKLIRNGVCSMSQTSGAKNRSYPTSQEKGAPVLELLPVHCLMNLAGSLSCFPNSCSHMVPSSTISLIQIWCVQECGKKDTNQRISLGDHFNIGRTTVRCKDLCCSKILMLYVSNLFVKQAKYKFSTIELCDDQV